jgi:Zn-dependent protease
MSWDKGAGHELVEPSYSYSYSLSPYGVAAPRRERFFGRTELRHIAIAVTVLTLAFTMVTWDYDMATLPWALGLSALAVVMGFFLHEMAHKVMAKRYGCWAEFRAYYGGLMLALLMSFFGFLFAAPGAVYIAGNVSKQQNGRISLAGPATNMAVALACLPFAFVEGFPDLVTAIASGLFFFNSFLAVFNLVPVPPLDGSKVWAWNKPLYVVSMAAAASLLVLAWL